MKGPIHGAADARFAAVRDAFSENFDRGEVGAACAVKMDGRTVVDLWGGFADDARTRAWQRDTLVNVYSVGKPFVALSLLQQVDAGEIRLEDAASDRWSELVAGQRGATVRQVLCHRAGVPAIREPLTNEDLWDWDTMASAIAATEPWWTPGERHAYHTNTYGFLVGELARRVTDELPGTWLREVAEPLGADVAWGVPDADLGRCAEILWDSPSPPALDGGTLKAMPEEQRMIALGYVNPPGFSGLGVVNTREWRGAQVPSTNLHATAMGIARMYAELAREGGTLLDADLLREATRTQSEGYCPVLEREVSFGLGFQPTRPDRPFGPNPGSFGHFGTGGAVGFADPGAGLAFGYVMNRVRPRWQNERNRALIDAVYGCL